MAIPLLCVVSVLVLLWLCVFCLFLLCCFWFAFLSVFSLGQLLDCVLVHYQHFCGFRQVDSPACKLQFNCLPRLNVCNDLAEAIKALDGKKTSCHRASCFSELVAIPLLCFLVLVLLWFRVSCLFVCLVCCGLFLMGPLTGLCIGPLPVLLRLSTCRRPCMIIYNSSFCCG